MSFYLKCLLAITSAAIAAAISFLAFSMCSSAAATTAVAAGALTLTAGIGASLGFGALIVLPLLLIGACLLPCLFGNNRHHYVHTHSSSQPDVYVTGGSLFFNPRTRRYPSCTVSHTPGFHQGNYHGHSTSMFRPTHGHTGNHSSYGSTHVHPGSSSGVRVR
ncbi:hypothetical protein [Legionella impletisoli]|uniref:hypothetical protein n=1 Tax=Legionella impletisoli TaxID=343510 RepID=UPI001041264A|nr:hypothetical protein [Legionella impletisoli]